MRDRVVDRLSRIKLSLVRRWLRVRAGDMIVFLTELCLAVTDHRPRCAGVCQASSVLLSIMMTSRVCNLGDGNNSKYDIVYKRSEEAYLNHRRSQTMRVRSRPRGKMLKGRGAIWDSFGSTACPICICLVSRRKCSLERLDRLLASVKCLSNGSGKIRLVGFVLPSV